MRRTALCLILFGGLAFVARAEGVAALPGVPETKPSLSPFPFPDRLTAYIWRNWTVVPKARLAAVVGASPEDLTAVAREMGLPPDPVVLPEWRTKGWITVLRRNWHLLPYDQLLELLRLTSEEMRFELMENDFLWVKLGLLKPKCEPLRFDARRMSATRAARLDLATILHEEGLDPSAAEEPRFSFIRDISTPLPSAPVAESDSPFDFRLIFSYFADYGDPLGDPEVGSYPEGLLQRLAAQGVNAVWLHTVLRTLVKDVRYPEFGAESERRLLNLQGLVDRAARYGIKVYLYMNEPRGLDPSFFRKLGRQTLAGATQGGLQTMCTLNPETQRWLSDSLEKVFRTVQGLGGIFTISASENLTNCAYNPGVKDSCPVCRSHSRAEIIATVNRAMVMGMAKGDPKAEALIWNWQWPVEAESEIVAALPKTNVRLMAVSENGMEVCRGGVKAVENDYSISIVGPGKRAKAFWRLARERQFEAVAKVQVNNSWELSTFPYLPTMELSARQAVNLANEGLHGVMLSWSLGCYPAANLCLYRDLRKGETTVDPLLDRTAVRLYGSNCVSRVRAAWRAFARGFEQYPFALGALYHGPQQWGPAAPIYPKPTGYTATMVGLPYDDLESWRAQYPADVYARLMGAVADGFAEGCRLMEGVADPKELALFRAEGMHFETCRDLTLYVMARAKGATSAMRTAVQRERTRAKAYWPLVRGDSRIGYESSNHYFYIPNDVLEKVLACRLILRDLDARPGDEPDGTRLRK